MSILFGGPLALANLDGVPDIYKYPENQSVAQEIVHKGVASKCGARKITLTSGYVVQRSGFEGSYVRTVGYIPIPYDKIFMQLCQTGRFMKIHQFE